MARTPLQSRLSDAIRQIGSQAPDPRLTVLMGGLSKHLANSPLPDQEIQAMLNWLQNLVTYVRGDDEPAPPDPAPIGQDEHFDFSHMD